jgi:hypothetical protein
MTEIQSRPRNGALRPVLWLLLVLSAAGNAGTSFGGMNLALHAACGAVTLGCAVALIVHHVRGRR